MPEPMEHYLEVDMHYLADRSNWDEVQAPAPGYGVVHNHVRPKRFPKLRQGQNGFRAWTQLLDPDKLEACDCPWAPQAGPHYRVKAVALRFTDAEKAELRRQSDILNRALPGMLAKTRATKAK